MCMQISPTTLFFIQGSGQVYAGAMCWGDGFITDPSIIAQTGLRLAHCQQRTTPHAGACAQIDACSSAS